MRGHQSSQSNWVSISDLMTGLMVIFMFIAINYIIEAYDFSVEAGSKEQLQIRIGDLQDSLKQYIAQIDTLKTELEKDIVIIKDIHGRLGSEFSTMIENDDITLLDDATIRINAPKGKELFKSGDISATKEFELILLHFIPKYLNVLLSKDVYPYLQEVRIEGHTDDERWNNMPQAIFDKKRQSKVWDMRFGKYESNVALSQLRALNVLQFIRRSDSFLALSFEERTRLMHFMSANGLSYSKLLNKDGKEVHYNGGNVDRKLSRRVEFRIVLSPQ